MDRDVAQRIVDAIIGPSPSFNELDSLSQQISDADEARAFRLALGQMMGATVALLRPVIKKFPDFDPDRNA